MAKSTETHTFHYQGSFLSSSFIHDWLVPGKINLTELKILLLVDALCNPREKQYCYASNNYITRSVGCSKAHAKKMLERLITAKLLIPKGQTIIHGQKRRLLASGISQPTLNNTEIGGLENLPEVGKFSPPEVGKITYPKSKCRSEGEEVKGGRTSAADAASPAPTAPPSFGFSQKPSNHRTTPQALDAHWSNQLRDYVKSRMIQPSISRKSWNQAFRILRQQVKDDQLIQNVLDFYITQHPLGNVKLPSVRSGLDFKNRWDWIYEKYLKDNKHKPASTFLSPAAKEILKYMTPYQTWPNGSEEQLAAAVQLSVERYDKVFDVFKHTDFENDSINSLTNKIAAFWGPSTSYIQRWFERIYKDVKKWEGWNGNLMALAFSTADKHFINAVHKEANDYAGKSGSKYAFEILKEVQE